MKNLRQLYLEAQGRQCPNLGIDLPLDLVMEIFVESSSKEYKKVLLRIEIVGIHTCLPFTELFLTKSPCRPPLLLFTFENKESIFFFSAPQPQNPGVIHLLYLLVIMFTASIIPKIFQLELVLLLVDSSVVKIRGKVDTIVVSNPVTGESIFLPEDMIPSTNSSKYCASSLGCPKYDNKGSTIVCFDVRSEKFSFINIDHQCMCLQFTLSNLRCLVFWVLEDAGKCKWSKCVYTIPPLWNNIVGRSDLDIVGVTSGGEVVLATMHLLHPFYIYYYNPKGNTFIRVLIRGLEGFVRARVYTSLDYAENLKHMTEYDKGVNTNIYSLTEAISSQLMHQYALLYIFIFKISFLLSHKICHCLTEEHVLKSQCFGSEIQCTKPI
ncbi:hypothetical protein HID58_091244 [Brassica napus]|uniref:F-box associated beta-propeller type 3 domain-containing protein n=1 Tax=Brassica napus TaxID=3708 RepID=A0ABQ7X3Y6_BRANA|nr:hypothetical protein HID58_091244 [Brassica napus]